MHLIIKNHACYNIMSAIASLIATYKHYALVLYFIIKSLQLSIIFFIWPLKMFPFEAMNKPMAIHL